MIKQQEKVEKVAGDAMEKLIAFCNTENMLNPKITMEGKTVNGEKYRLIFEKVATKESDELYENAKQLCIEEGYGSSSLLMRRFSIDYYRAGRIMDALEDAKVISKFTGSAERRCLIKG